MLCNYQVKITVVGLQIHLRRATDLDILVADA